jgi:antitoxin MazE
MLVARWGNSLAVRLPKAVVEALALKEGDDIALVPADPGIVLVTRSTAREEAVARMRARQWLAPEGYRFDRDEANAR